MPPISYDIHKSRSTEPHNAIFDVAFHGLTSSEAAEFLIVMRRLQKMRDGALINVNKMVQFLDAVVVAVKCVHENGAMTKLQSEDILNSVECPVSLDPNPAAELWATRIVVGMFALAVVAFWIAILARSGYAGSSA